MALCKCANCGRLFGSLSAFDRHRVGRYRDQSRRCMTEAEIALSRLASDSRGVYRDASGGRYRPEGDRRFQGRPWELRAILAGIVVLAVYGLIGASDVEQERLQAAREAAWPVPVEGDIEDF